MAGIVKNTKRKKQFSTVAVLIAVIICIVMMINNRFFEKAEETQRRDDSIFYMSVIDVGQGDSVLLSVGEYDILIDAGDRDAGEAVTEHLERMSVEDIDMLVATHPHADHIGGMTEVFEKYTVKKVLMPELNVTDLPSTATYERFIDCVTSSRANTDGEIYYAVPGDTYSFGELTVTVLAPFECTDDYNNDSVVLRADFGETSFLLTGDAEKPLEEEILSSGQNIDVDVLKVGHHGSSSSTSESFLQAIRPKYAAISCGRDNSYGHPHYETLEILNEYAVQTARTDISGTIIYTSNGTEVTCHT